MFSLRKIIFIALISTLASFGSDNINQKSPKKYLITQEILDTFINKIKKTGGSLIDPYSQFSAKLSLKLKKFTERTLTAHAWIYEVEKNYKEVLNSFNEPTRKYLQSIYLNSKIISSAASVLDLPEN